MESCEQASSQKTTMRNDEAHVYRTDQSSTKEENEQEEEKDSSSSSRKRCGQNVGDGEEREEIQGNM